MKKKMSSIMLTLVCLLTVPLSGCSAFMNNITDFLTKDFGSPFIFDDFLCCYGDVGAASCYKADNSEGIIILSLGG